VIPFDCSASFTREGCWSLLGRPDPPHDVGTGVATRHRPEDHDFGLVRNDADQRLDGVAVGYQHERSRSAPIGYHLSQLAESSPRVGVPVRNESPGLLDRADGHQGSRIQAPAYWRGSDAVHAHTVGAEGLTKRPGLLAPFVVQVALRGAI